MHAWSAARFFMAVGVRRLAYGQGGGKLKVWLARQICELLALLMLRIVPYDAKIGLQQLRPIFQYGKDILVFGPILLLIV